MSRARIILICFVLLGVHLSLTPVQAGVTSLRLSSEPGEFVGGGQELFFTDLDGSFTAERIASDSVAVWFRTPDFAHFWHLDRKSVV